MSARIIPPLADLPAKPERIVLHWTGGGPYAGAIDRQHYHYIVQQDGAVVEGIHSVALNMRRIKAGAYAAHTRALNSFSVGISLAGMRGAREGGPYGDYPITERQTRAALRFVAKCCKAWGLDPENPEHVLTHAEVRRVYGVPQPGKWDIAVLPWSGLTGAERVGDWMREHTAAYMHDDELARLDNIPAPSVVQPNIPVPLVEKDLTPREARHVMAEAMTSALADDGGGEDKICAALDAAIRHQAILVGIARIVRADSVVRLAIDAAEIAREARCKAA